MKLLSRSLSCVAAVGWLLTTTPAFPDAPFHIGICTETQASWPEPFLGAQQLVREYGSVKDGGYVQHVTSPKELASMAKDPLMKVVVACTVGKGVSDAYRTLRTKRPDIVLLAGDSWDDPTEIQRSADLVLDFDSVAKGFAIPWVARQLGAGALLFVSMQRHLDMKDRIGRNKAVMEQACKDLGLTFAYVEAVDPRGNRESAKAFIAENVPKWIQKYGAAGAKVAFYSTQDALAGHLARQVLDNPGAVFVEEEYASPLTIDTDLFALDPKAEQYDFSALMKKIEAGVSAKGANGRIGTSIRGADFVFTAGLGEFGKRLVEGKAQLSNLESLYDALGKYAPGSSWKGVFHKDALTGERSRTRLMLRTDTYIFGRGFMGATTPEVPESYYAIRP